MGTRSLTRIFDGEQEIACIYRQFDGYKSGHGAQLAEFIPSRPFVNGISGSREVFNGMGCFAAQLIGHLKKGEAGHIYMVAPGSRDQWEEFVYEIHGGLDSDHKPLAIRVTVAEPEKVTFTGTATEFASWCAAEEETGAAQ